MSDLKEMCEMILPIAQGILRESGRISPHALVVPKNAPREFTYVALAIDKKHWNAAMLNVLREAEALRYAFVDEVWAVTAKEMPALPLVLSPSENPLHVEAIMVMGRERTGESYAISQQFLRDHDGIKFLEKQETTQMIDFRTPMEW